MALRDHILESASIKNGNSGLIWAHYKHKNHASQHGKFCLAKKTLFYNLELEGEHYMKQKRQKRSR